MSAARVVSFGEILLRLAAPGREPLLASPWLETCFGGAEANVAVALSHIGIASKMVTLLPDNRLGESARDVLRGHGVDMDGVAFAPGRLGLYFLAPGAGPRASEVIYDRAGSVFAEAAAAFDWPRLLAGAEWLHLSGITLALGGPAEQAAVAAAAAARAMGCKVSFDCNYRARLWAARGGDPREAITALIAQAELIFADHRDLHLLTGKSITQSNPVDQQRDVADAFFAHVPGLQRLAYVSRAVGSHDQHRLTGRLSVRGAANVESKPWSLDNVVDRVGGGDAFAAGMLASILRDRTPQDAVDFATAVGALKHTLPGDFFTLSEAAIMQAMGGRADVVR